MFHFYTPFKTADKLCFSDFFRGGRNGTLASNGSSYQTNLDLNSFRTPFQCFQICQDDLYVSEVCIKNFLTLCLVSTKWSLREKCPNTEFFLVRIFLYSGQKKLRIWTLFTQGVRQMLKILQCQIINFKVACIIFLRYCKKVF